MTASQPLQGKFEPSPEITDAKRSLPQPSLSSSVDVASAVKSATRKNRLHSGSPIKSRRGGAPGTVLSTVDHVRSRVINGGPPEAGL